ncbi:MAG: DUF1592 domain-containing protein, partial [Opitutales bacterium]
SKKSRFIYLQNLFDNGRLNDFRSNHFHKEYQHSLPRAVVQSIEFEAPIIDVWPPLHHKRILFDSTLDKNSPQYIRKVLERFISRAFRRPATYGEVDQFMEIYKLLEPEYQSMEGTMRETLAMVLISPQFLFHTVAAEGIVTPQYELASRLSYFLFGSMPDKELLQLAEAGLLDKRENIEKQVERMLADERADDFIRNFTLQWLSIEKTIAVNINQRVFPRFLQTSPNGERQGTEVLFRPTVRHLMLDETVAFISELIKRNASILNIIDSDFACVNERLAAHYGIEGVRGYDIKPVAVRPEHNLGGLLTHGSVLVGNGTGTAPHPIYRAVWLREAILGEKVAPPPADVPDLTQTAGDSAEEAVSIKEMLKIHRTKESCNDCHARLDPWGIPFEEYNAIGQYQPMVSSDGVRVNKFNEKEHKDLLGYLGYLDSIYTVEVDTQSRVPSGHDVNGMLELKQYLLTYRKDDIVENVIRRLMTYGIGRELTPLDRLAVEQIRESTKHNEHAFKDLIVEICASELFRNPTQRTTYQIITKNEH